MPSIEDIVKGKKEMREMEEMVEGRRRKGGGGGGGGARSNFKHDKVVVLNDGF